MHKRNRKLVIFATIILFILSLMPCIYRTYTWAGDAYGLTTLATMPDDRVSFNPYSKNGYFINQDLAAWLLENTDYPYERCSRLSDTIRACDTSLVNWIGRTLDLPEVDTGRAYALLAHFIGRGEPVNEMSNGLAPVHEAILYNNPHYLDVLLEAGAEINTPVEKPEKLYDGYNAIQFLLFLEGVTDTDYNALWDVLERHNR